MLSFWKWLWTRAILGGWPLFLIEPIERRYVAAMGLGDRARAQRALLRALERGE